MKFFRVLLFSIIFFVGVAILITSVFSNSSNGNEPKKVNNTTSTSIKQEKSNVFKIGDKIKMDSNILTVTKLERSIGNDYEIPTGDNIFIIVSVIIENSGNKDISYNSLDFFMLNSSGQKTGTTITMIDQDTALQSGELVPGGKVSGTIVFQEPKNDNNLQLQYNPSFFDNNTIKVNLQ